MTAEAFLEAAQRALPQRLARWTPHLYCASLLESVCPWLLAAILDRESNGGETLKPPGPMGLGDGGHGRGLMQIDDRAHGQFLIATFDNGKPLWQHAGFNILYGAELLSRLLVLSGGDETAALCAYNAGYSRVRRVLASHAKSNPETRSQALNDLTTQRNYAFDVLRRRSDFLEKANVL